MRFLVFQLYFLQRVLFQSSQIIKKAAICYNKSMVLHNFFIHVFSTFWHYQQIICMCRTNGSLNCKHLKGVIIEAINFPAANQIGSRPIRLEAASEDIKSRDRINFLPAELNDELHSEKEKERARLVRGMLISHSCLVNI